MIFLFRICILILQEIVFDDLLKHAAICVAVLAQRPACPDQFSGVVLVLFIKQSHGSLFSVERIPLWKLFSAGQIDCTACKELSKNDGLPKERWACTHEVGRGHAPRDDQIVVRKETLKLLLGSEEEHTAFMKQYDVCEHLKDLLARLMDRSDHQPVAHGQFLQEIHNMIGRVRIQARRWFVQEQDL